MTRAGRVAFAAGALLVSAVAAAKAAQSPFGVGTPDAQGGGFGGPLAPLFAWIAIHQQRLYQSLTGALGSLKQDSTGIWLLFGVSFAYGVFHAAGPGHGKAVITSYMLASGETIRRGISLSFMAALVQAASAIIIVGIGTILLKVSATAMTRATDWVEIVSYAAIALFGAWLLWSKIRGDHHHHHHVTPGEDEPTDGHQHAHTVEHVHSHSAHDHGRDEHHRHDHAHHDHGHAHQGAQHSRSFLARAWSAVLAVGIRPCSGAIIVLVFAWSQGLFEAGIAATLIMALGTGLTVAALATLAVSARGVALRMAGSGNAVAILGRGIEIAGAACVLLLGLLLLGGALSNGLPG